MYNADSTNIDYFCIYSFRAASDGSTALGSSVSSDVLGGYAFWDIYYTVVVLLKHIPPPDGFFPPLDQAPYSFKAVESLVRQRPPGSLPVLETRLRKPVWILCTF